jgi:hypothetical protein
LKGLEEGLEDFAWDRRDPSVGPSFADLKKRLPVLCRFEKAPAQAPDVRLVKAAVSGDDGIMFSILKEGTNFSLLNSQDYMGRTLLHEACQSCNIEMSDASYCPIVLLLAHKLGADCRIQDWTGKCAAHYAAGKGCVGALKALMEGRTESTMLQSGLFAVDAAGNTPLQLAAARRQYSVVCYIISQAGATVARLPLEIVTLADRHVLNIDFAEVALQELDKTPDLGVTVAGCGLNRAGIAAVFASVSQNKSVCKLNVAGNGRTFTEAMLMVELSGTIPHLDTMLFGNVETPLSYDLTSRSANGSVGVEKGEHAVYQQEGGDKGQTQESAAAEGFFSPPVAAFSHPEEEVCPENAAISGVIRRGQTAMNVSLVRLDLCCVNVLAAISSCHTPLLSVTAQQGMSGYSAASLLQKCSSLKHIDISLNCLGLDGGKAIADVLKSNSTVSDLNVSSNNLGAEGGKAIAASIADNSSITSVSNFSMLFLETFRGRDSHEITVS